MFLPENDFRQMQKQKSLKCRCRSEVKLFKISFVYVIFVTKALSYFRWYTLKSQSPNCSSEYFDLPIIFKNQFLLIKLYFFTIYIDGPFSRFQLENLFMLVDKYIQLHVVKYVFSIRCGTRTKVKSMPQLSLALEVQMTTNKSFQIRCYMNSYLKWHTKGRS